MTKYEKLCITCHVSRCDGPNAKRCPQQKLKKAETIARRAYHRQRYQEKKQATGGYWPQIHGELDAKILE